MSACLNRGGALFVSACLNRGGALLVSACLNRGRSSVSVGLSNWAGALNVSVGVSKQDRSFVIILVKTWQDLSVLTEQQLW